MRTIELRMILSVTLPEEADTAIATEGIDRALESLPSISDAVIEALLGVGIAAEVEDWDASVVEVPLPPDRIDGTMLCTVNEDGTVNCFLMTDPGDGHGEVEGNISPSGECRIEIKSDNWNEALSGKVRFDEGEIKGRLKSASGDEGDLLLLPDEEQGFCDASMNCVHRRIAGGGGGGRSSLAALGMTTLASSLSRPPAVDHGKHVRA